MATPFDLHREQLLRTPEACLVVREIQRWDYESAQAVCLDSLKVKIEKLKA